MVHAKATTVVAACLVPLSTSLSAKAEDHPYIQELLDACNHVTDVCQFNPYPGQAGYYLAQEHQVGAAGINCTSVPAHHQIGWSDTTGESNTVGFTVTAEYQFLLDVFSASFQATYGHTWLWSSTNSETDTIDLVGWISRAQSMQWMNGQLEEHFGWRYYGHYFWYIDNFRSDGPDPATNNDKVVFYQRPMSGPELSGYCNGALPEGGKPIEGNLTVQILRGQSIPSPGPSSPPHEPVLRRPR